ncbi:methyl-accepting chemotaxis protein [Aestuariibacter halophilus]|uniref:Methyl-accepting chemotaxis protein n=1 Tax=Fluctibacter halophilus TaxID=226011 RepID=A0ABS8G4N0_9ALTE|nr:methyl-accepting chemotaxis protein [Aestuariibacter halophilus]MCC2615490.1 methyl-accepting chemotaxis protein [Aestuariibacter halophilus]
MKVKHKLVVLVTFPAILALSLILGIHQSMNQLSQTAQAVIDERLAPMLILNQLNSVYSRSIIDLAHKTRAQMLFWNESEQALAEARAELDVLWQQYRSGRLSAQEQTVLDASQEAFEQAEKTIASIEGFIAEKSSYSMGNFIDLNLYQGIEPIIQVIATLTEIQESMAGQTATQAAELRSERQVFLYVLGTALVLLSTGFGLWIMLGLQKDLDQLLTTITQIEKNRDLTLRSSIRSQNEFGDMSRRFDRMIEVFAALLTDTQQSGMTLHTHSETLYNSACDNKQQSERQQQALTTTRDTMAALKNSAQVVLENVQTTNALTENVQRITDDGEAAVQQTVQSISDVAGLVNKTSDSMSQLRDHSEQIGSVITVINTIAEQTNLLALNAAIEAARAGEQGRGFAVVAGEVRELASRTAESTAEIQGIIQKIQSSTEASWSLMQHGEKATQQAVSLAQSSGAQLTELKQQFERIVERSQQIRDAADSQTRTVDNMELTIDDLSELAKDGTLRSMANVQAAQQMSSTVQQVTDNLKKFVVI